MWAAENVPNETTIWAKKIFKQNVESANWVILAAYDKDGERGVKKETLICKQNL